MGDQRRQIVGIICLDDMGPLGGYVLGVVEFGACGKEGTGEGEDPVVLPP